MSELQNWSPASPESPDEDVQKHRANRANRVGAEFVILSSPLSPVKRRIIAWVWKAGRGTRPPKMQTAGLIEKGAGRCATSGRRVPSLVIPEIAPAIFRNDRRIPHSPLGSRPGGCPGDGLSAPSTEERCSDDRYASASYRSSNAKRSQSGMKAGKTSSQQESRE